MKRTELIRDLHAAGCVRLHHGARQGSRQRADPVYLNPATAAPMVERMTSPLALSFVKIIGITGLLLTLTSPALASRVHCLTYEEKTLGRLQTICSDGTRGVSTYNKTLQRWETMLTPPLGQTCTRRLNPKTQQWEGRCR